MHLYSLTILRAVAITMVVFGHCFALGSLDVDTVTERFFVNLVAGATVIFVFVSGFLFHHVFMRDFQFGRFYQKKFLNVFTPYLILCSLALVLGIGRVWNVSPFDSGPAAQMSFLVGTGYPLMAYWYIPFIMLTFALAPLHVRFSHLSPKWQGAWMLGLLAISMLLHRPDQNVSPLHSVLYFAPVYLFGIFCSQNRDRIYAALEGRSLYLLAPIAFLAWLQAALGTSGNYYRTTLGFEGVDLMLLQKLVMCVFLMVFLRKFETYRSAAIDTLANTSFAIFFLHPFALHYMLQIKSGQLSAWLPAGESVFVYLLGASIIVAACMAVAIAMKQLIGRRSRMVIGY